MGVASCVLITLLLVYCGRVSISLDGKQTGGGNGPLTNYYLSEIEHSSPP